MRSHLRLAAVLSTVLASGAGCATHASYIATNAQLGRVVIYRNGVAFYERHAEVSDGKLVVRVPRDRVDDFLKSLTVVDLATKAPLPITIPRQQASDGAYLTMALETPTHGKTNVLLTYVTESPAWKPSYRIVVGDTGKVLLEGWAVVDNTSGEDWKGVRVGVGASSALSFRYDLWSVRTIDREMLAEQEQFAVAPPTGLSPYGGGGGGAAEVAAAPARDVIELAEDEIRRRPGDASGVSLQGSSTTENRYHSVDTGGKSGPTTGAMQGAVKDADTKQALVGVTVVVESPSMQGVQTAITDENGSYKLTSLPPGEYVVTFYYNDVTVRRTGVPVGVSKTTPMYQSLRNSSGGGETIAITGTAPTVDTSSTSQGITLSKEYVQNIPTGRTFGSAAGSQSDGYGTSFSGSSSAEGQYVVDGVNTSDSGSGTYQGPTPADGDRKVAALVAKLRGNHADVLIEAHAEAGIPGADGRARDRANVVKNQLIDAGVAPARIKVAYQVGSGEAERVSLALVAPSRSAAEQAARGGGPASTSTDDAPVGESHFLAEKPMNVGAGTSAMVSMLRDETPGGVVYLYDPVSDRGNTRYAFRAVRLDNPTDDTLEPGPVTVYGDARFIGEGLTDSIPPRATAVIPFALDRQIVVEPTVDDDDQISKLVTLERGVLTAEVQHLRHTRLAITSRLHHDTTLYIRHRIEDGWVLTESPEHGTRTGDAHLFSIDVPAGGTAEVVISEATPMQRTLQLASPTALGMLDVFVASPQPTPELKARLTELLSTHRQIGDAVERIETLRDQLAEYRQRSDELQAQLFTLKAVKTGGELMRVLKKKMIEMSERVQTGTIALVDAQERLLIAKTQFANQLAELKLPDALSGNAKAAAAR